MEEEEPEYFYRLVYLIIDVGTEVLRKVFKANIPSGKTVQTFLQDKTSEISKLKKKVITDEQFRILNKGDVSEFDISLMYVVLRNLVSIQEPVNGWEAKVLLSSDKTPGASLLKLKNIRNEGYAHIGKTALTKSKFERFWKDGADALTNLSNQLEQTEKDAVLQQIKTGETQQIPNERKADQLKVLVKWVADEVSGQKAMLEELNSKADEHGADISSIKLSMKNIEDFIKGLPSSGNPGPGSTTEIDTRGSTGADGQQLGSVVAELKWEIQNMKEFILQMLTNTQIRITRSEKPQPTPIDNPNALSDEELVKFSDKLGDQWSTFATYLGFSKEQKDQLENAYPRQLGNLIEAMIREWHEVVARCDDENPKFLLAAAFAGINDNRTACEVLEGNRTLLKEVRQLRPKSETEKKIKSIRFSAPSQSTVIQAQQVVIQNIGAPNSVNTFPEATTNINSIQFSRN